MLAQECHQLGLLLRAHVAASRDAADLLLVVRVDAARGRASREHGAKHVELAVALGLPIDE
eukprot:847101-Prymnesium_polylepis.1